jgi:hypothetical protein
MLAQYLVLYGCEGIGKLLSCNEMMGNCAHHVQRRTEPSDENGTNDGNKQIHDLRHDRAADKQRPLLETLDKKANDDYLRLKISLENPRGIAGFFQESFVSIIETCDPRAIAVEVCTLIPY